MAVTFASACHRAAAASARAPSGAFATDSVQGIVQEVGADADRQVVLMLDDASHTIALDGPAALNRVHGLRVAVIGTRLGSRLTVNRFVVVAANGVAAIDGKLAASRDSLVIVTADGRRFPVTNPSPVLRNWVGHRVWISGPLDRPPVAYGIIE